MIQIRVFFISFFTFFSLLTPSIGATAASAAQDLDGDIAFLKQNTFQITNAQPPLGVLGRLQKVCQNSKNLISYFQSIRPKDEQGLEELKSRLRMAFMLFYSGSTYIASDSEKTMERHLPYLPSAGAFITTLDPSTQERLMLIGQRKTGKADDGTWCSLGGKGEKDETVATAAQREVKEESNNVIDINFQNTAFHKTVYPDRAPFFQFHGVIERPADTSRMNNSEFYKHAWIPVSVFLNMLERKELSTSYKGEFYKFYGPFLKSSCAWGARDLLLHPDRGINTQSGVQWKLPKGVVAANQISSFIDPIQTEELQEEWDSYKAKTRSQRPATHGYPRSSFSGSSHASQAMLSPAEAASASNKNDRPTQQWAAAATYDSSLSRSASSSPRPQRRSGLVPKAGPSDRRFSSSNAPSAAASTSTHDEMASLQMIIGMLEEDHRNASSEDEERKIQLRIIDVQNQITRLLMRQDPFPRPHQGPAEQVRSRPLQTATPASLSQTPRDRGQQIAIKKEIDELQRSISFLAQDLRSDQTTPEGRQLGENLIKKMEKEIDQLQENLKTL